ncbi:MAG: ribonuclease E inhibitor RraB [Planctomycetes bacterium]|nr:ribonuclease E inhibitor RraB [Planctomycetota bacterium]
MPHNAHPLVIIVAMGFFSSLFGCSNENEGGNGSSRYVSEKSFRENLAKQTDMSPQTVAQLRKHGVTDDMTLKLEFFFYTDIEEKAHALAAPLQKLNYKVETGPSAGDDKLILVTGWTVPIKMDDRSVVNWTEKMCRLGYKHDCEFDGWGTNPKQ